jgi:serine/threonine protein kinase
MNFNFPPKQGTGIDKLLPHASPESLDLLKKLLIYDPDERYSEKKKKGKQQISPQPNRWSARQALKHPYFKEFREAENRAKAANVGPSMPMPEEEESDNEKVAHLFYIHSHPPFFFFFLVDFIPSGQGKEG